MRTVPTVYMVYDVVPDTFMYIYTSRRMERDKSDAERDGRTGQKDVRKLCGKDITEY